jgi:hypothetical protein
MLAIVAVPIMAFLATLNPHIRRVIKVDFKPVPYSPNNGPYKRVIKPPIPNSPGKLSPL